ncbi:protein kinase domain-containing protein [Prescottella agglutinans]|uniref:protein kinase domain-containing protein n=1 Tax=Prescottella agglutinans TaxID=1644129 RepID=UPI003D97DC9E
MVGFDSAVEIGRGGFGIVYRCTQVGLDRTVAVKMFAAEPDAENLPRFLREQRAMGRLTGHPNIVGILQVGQTESGRPFLVMQYHQQGSLDDRIRSSGPLPVQEVLRLGVKMAGALETAHRLGIVHRDVKPANILFTDYGEPALADFGLAHISGGFQTATGIVAGSPAFTAPEVLGGQPPTPASDVYGLGATLFCALTGHAAFERYDGERLVAQFLRITTQPVPDLRESGIPTDVSAAIEAAMSRDPLQRPTPEALGDVLRRLERSHRQSVEDTVPWVDPLAQAGSSARDEVATADAHQQPSRRGNLPTELTSFVGRRTELAHVRDSLSAARLVTLTGIGGVGKTRIALRAAATAQRAFPDGVWLVELGELRDPALVIELVATTLGIRDQSARPLRDVLVDIMAPRTTLLVLDNCEQVIAAVADLAQALLTRCPTLRILATSREALAIGGESVIRVSPLTTPDADSTPSRRDVSRFDAMTLFAERASSVVPGFELTDDNRGVVAQICTRLDGLPLAIELAATRIRTLPPEQILQRLTDRFVLLTRGSRSAPTRQQTLRWAVSWSYDLCTPAEQQLWGRLSVFAGSVDLDAAEYVCGGDGVPDDLLDTMTALVDKSILICEESNGEIRFRMLDTIREYGQDTLEHADRYEDLRRRHRDWYQRLTLAAEAEWISPRQLDWITRLERELPNLREALECSLSERDGSALQIAAALYQFWRSRGLVSEGRRWLERALAEPRHRSIVDRAKAIFAAAEFAAIQGDRAAADTWVDEARALEAQDVEADPLAHAYVAAAEGFVAVTGGDLDRARESLEGALAVPGVPDELPPRIYPLLLLGWVDQLSGRTARALAHLEKALAITESRGESVYRSYALAAMGIALWRHGDTDSALQQLDKALLLTRAVGNLITTSTCLQEMAWIASERNDSRRAAVMMGAAAELRDTVGSPAILFPALNSYREQSERKTRRALGARAFEAAYREGRSLDLEAAIAFALGERSPERASAARAPTDLTTREHQVAELVAEGLTNKAIAARLVLSQRTVDGHVEHVLAKLGFTSRAQIAAWFVEQEHVSST